MLPAPPKRLHFREHVYRMFKEEGLWKYESLGLHLITDDPRGYRMCDKCHWGFEKFLFYGVNKLGTCVYCASHAGPAAWKNLEVLYTQLVDAGRILLTQIMRIAHSQSLQAKATLTILSPAQRARMEQKRAEALAGRAGRNERPHSMRHTRAHACVHARMHARTHAWHSRLPTCRQPACPPAHTHTRTHTHTHAWPARKTHVYRNAVFTRAACLEGTCVTLR